MKQILLATFILIASATKTCAVRPFIADDTPVARHSLFQIETWSLFDKFSGQHWTMLSYGLSERLELAAGGVWGYDRPQLEHSELSCAMPLLEAKFLFREHQPNKLPGIALAAGTFLPAGKGAFTPPGYGAYGFFTATQCFGKDENVLIHGNIGVNYLYADKGNQFFPIWELGVQVKAYKGLHIFGEIVEGDPYMPGTGLVCQTGIRYFINDLIQVDVEVGQGIIEENREPFWIGFGARFVITKFEKKKVFS